MFKAEIKAHSVDERGNELLTMSVTFPRIILSEMNTHRMLCVSGDTMLEFDLPTPATGSDTFKSYKMSIRDFVRKFNEGIKPRKRHKNDVNLEKDKIYTVQEISNITNKHKSNIRSVCRKGLCKVLNPHKKRNEDFLIKGSDYNFYHNGYEKINSAKHRYSKMKIRILNEATGLIEHSTVEDAFYSGNKKTYTLTTESGKSIRTTKEHQILTSEGWKQLQDIAIGDFVISQTFGTEYKSDYIRKVDGKWISTFLRNSRNHIQNIQKNKCKNCEEEIVDLHHIKPVYKYPEEAFNIDNIIGLCESCHHKEHEKQDWQTSKYLYGKEDKVVSIIEYEEEDVYDITIKGIYSNFVANGIIVHNCKNTSSSRAIPFEKMVQSVEENPFIPIAWQKRHSGMQGTQYISHPDSIALRELQWLNMRDKAVKAAESLSTEFSDREDGEGVTKQLTNRLLEPFMWTTMLVTGPVKGGWDNFFHLRNPVYELFSENMPMTFKSKKELNKYVEEVGDEPYNLSKLDWLKVNRGQGEIHIMKIAEMIYDELQESTPVLKKAGEWHIPYFNNYNFLGPSSDVYSVEDLVKVATSMAARESYTTVDGVKEVTFEEHLKLYDKLVAYEPPHSSPMEHCGKAMSELENSLFTKTYVKEDEDTGAMIKVTEEGWCRNIRGFIPLRHLVETKIK